MAEAFCGLKTGSPGSALKALGFIHPCCPLFAVWGDPWGEVPYRQKWGSPSWVLLLLGRQTGAPGAQLSLQTMPPPPGMLPLPSLLWDTPYFPSHSFSFLPVLG